MVSRAALLVCLPTYFAASIQTIQRASCDPSDRCDARHSGDRTWTRESTPRRQSRKNLEKSVDITEKRWHYV